MKVMMIIIVVMRRIVRMRMEAKEEDRAIIEEWKKDWRFRIRRRRKFLNSSSTYNLDSEFPMKW